MPFDDRLPFSRAAALAAGLSRHQLAGPGYTRLLHDTYVNAAVAVTPRIRALAAVGAAGPPAHASHSTAGALWDTWLPPDPDLHASVPAGRPRSKRRGLRVHIAGPHHDTLWLGDVPLSSPTQTFLDMAPTLSLVELVVLGDSLVRRRTTPEALIAAADAWQGRGAVAARRAARLVRRGVDSPMETRLRLLLILAGYPEPVVAHELPKLGGQPAIRLDLAYPQWRVAIEYDGRHHAESDVQWQRDLDRREQLDGIVWRLVVVRSPGIYVDPGTTLSRVRLVLQQVGVALPPPRGDEWRRHFPGRVDG